MWRVAHLDWTLATKTKCLRWPSSQLVAIDVPVAAVVVVAAAAAAVGFTPSANSHCILPDGSHSFLCVTIVLSHLLCWSAGRSSNSPVGQSSSWRLIGVKFERN